MAFNPITQFKALVGLPGARRKAKEAQAQEAAIQARLTQAQPAGVPSPIGRQQAPEVASAPTTGTPSLDIEAIKGKVGEIEEQAKGIQGKVPLLKSEEELTRAEELVKAAQTKRLEAEKVTPAETEAEQTLENLLASEALGVQRVKEKPIPMEFITGQQKAIQERAAAQAIPLKARIATLQSRRQAAIGSAKVGIEEAEALKDIATERYTRLKPATETQTERDRKIKVEVIKKAFPELNKSRGIDGYVDPGVYLNLRQQYAGAIGDPKGFDDIFSPMLSPQERARLFTEKSVPGTGTIKKESGIDFENL